MTPRTFSNSVRAVCAAALVAVSIFAPKAASADGCSNYYTFIDTCYSVVNQVCTRSDGSRYIKFSRVIFTGC